MRRPGAAIPTARHPGTAPDNGSCLLSKFGLLAAELPLIASAAQKRGRGWLASRRGRCAIIATLANPPRKIVLAQRTEQLFGSLIFISGIFLGAVITFALLMGMRMDARDVLSRDDPEVYEAIQERIRPIGQVALLGDAELEAQMALAAAPARVETQMSGPQVYNEACFMCHSSPGVGGAPVTGEPEHWTARVAQGMDTLIDHAINGFQGAAGYMPPKGGRVDLSDEEVVAAVDYMLDQLD
jgi:cytochrome c5